MADFIEINKELYINRKYITKYEKIDDKWNVCFIVGYETKLFGGTGATKGNLSMLTVRCVGMSGIPDFISRIQHRQETEKSEAMLSKARENPDYILRNIW